MSLLDDGKVTRRKKTGALEYQNQPFTFSRTYLQYTSLLLNQSLNAPQVSSSGYNLFCSNTDEII